MNASPDLQTQIGASPDLQASAGSARNSPVAGVFLTNADLDHVLGLFTLREGNRLSICAPPAVRDALSSGLGFAAALDGFCGLDWSQPDLREPAPVAFADIQSPSLLSRAIELPGSPPPYAKNGSVSGAHSVAYQFVDGRTGGRLLVAPDVAAVTEELLQALESSDAVLFDGTFWSETELMDIKPSARTAGQMGHVTIQGCSLELLRGFKAPRKVYVHINNTNPALRHSPERASIEAAGITVGYDGMEFEL